MDVEASLRRDAKSGQLDYFWRQGSEVTRQLRGIQWRFVTTPEARALGRGIGIRSLLAKRLAPSWAEGSSVVYVRQGFLELVRKRQHDATRVRRRIDRWDEPIRYDVQRSLKVVWVGRGHAENIANCFEPVGKKPFTFDPGNVAGSTNIYVRILWFRPWPFGLVREGDKRWVEWASHDAAPERIANFGDLFSARGR